ncbi:MAG: hypothetical protein RIS76_4305 [Verrucomicrobiota bacterium]
MHPGRSLLTAALLGFGLVTRLAAGAEHSAEGGKHWAFAPLSEPAIPATHREPWARNPVDRFILARLEAEGLSPAPEADRLTWLRRVCLDLTGIPPTPDQVEAFLNDSSATAPARVVEALLASPRYGERWAQHWLDVVRYADTHGFEVNTERPHAWPYRDYVIRAFNRDTPYDRFIREQIVGDTLGEDAATGFLVTASVLLPGQIGQDDPSKRLARQDALDEIVINTGQTFLGLSVGCARCHDHKFDPISQRDYYAMQSFFAGVEYEDRELHTPEADAQRAEERRLRGQLARVQNQLTRFAPLANSGKARVAVNARLNVDRFNPVMARRVRFTIRETNSLEPCVDELEIFDEADTNVAAASTGATVTSSGDMVVEDRHLLRHLTDGRYGNSHSWMSNEKGRGWVVVEFPQARLINRVLWGRDRNGEFSDRLATRYLLEAADDSGDWRTLAGSEDRTNFVADGPVGDPFSAAASQDGEPEESQELRRERKSIQSALATTDVGRKAFAGLFRTPDTIRRLNRGDPEQPKEEIAPAVPVALADRSLPCDAPEQARRQTLADWIASPDNPLTARVMVNRIWQGHFGTGLVGTPSDFGLNGAKPTHPELLDWLAAEFIRTGWSVKQLHRLLVLSATYRQSGRIEANAAARDADDRLLWRFPTRRIGAESLRDSMLAVSGRLNPVMYGRGFDLFDKRGGLSGFKPVESFTADGLRRMIYAHKVRREREAVFGAFDCPDAGQSTAQRRESITPIQALNLFNSRFTVEESTAFAQRARDGAGDAVEEQIRHAYLLALGRNPTFAELADAAPTVQEHGLAALCRALFNSNEFLFIP